MTQRSLWLLIAALSLNPAYADAPADIGTKPAAKPTTAPTTKPKAAAKSAATTKPSAVPKTAKDISTDDMLNQMLTAPAQTGNKPLPPLPSASVGGVDKSSGAGAVAPAAPKVNVVREGTFLIDRVGRLSRSADGKQSQFVFETDGTSLQDPPLIILPNIKLMQMENSVNGQNRRDVRFRVSGMLTEYRGRNYILLDKLVVVPDVLDKY